MNELLSQEAVKVPSLLLYIIIVALFFLAKYVFTNVFDKVFKKGAKSDADSNVNIDNGVIEIKKVIAENYKEFISKNESLHDKIDELKDDMQQMNLTIIANQERNNNTAEVVKEHSIILKQHSDKLSNIKEEISNIKFAHFKQHNEKL